MYILTKHPDKSNAKFLRDIDVLEGEDIKYCIISSPTARHLDDLKRCSKSLDRLKKVLIEKPLECSYRKGRELKDIAKRYGLDVFTAYNFRFLDVFDQIKTFLKERKNKIRIVEVVAGQDLREWRPYKALRQSYSAFRKQGGGVDLDLSHEIDYILWLLGDRFKHKMMHRYKISNLKIDSPDIFKMIFDYGKFIVDITLDYIRKPKERYLRIICDNGEGLHYDFIKGILKINGRTISNNHKNTDESYKKLLKAFLGIDRIGRSKLCSVNGGLRVLKVLEV